MGLWLTRVNESRCHPGSFAVTLSEAKGLQFARSPETSRKSLILRGADLDFLAR